MPQGYTPDAATCNSSATRLPSPALRLGAPSGSGAAPRGVPADRTAQTGRVPAALPRDCPAWPSRIMEEKGTGLTRKRRWRTAAARAGGAAPRWPCWWATSSASATWTPYAGGLTLERFISEDTTLLPDIDLDFPRQLRDELIQPGAPALRAGVRRPCRGRLHLQRQGHHPGLGQGPGICPGTSCPCCPSSCIPTTPPRWPVPRCGNCPPSATGWTPPAGATCSSWRRS